MSIELGELVEDHEARMEIMEKEEILWTVGKRDGSGMHRNKNQKLKLTGEREGTDCGC